MRAPLDGVWGRCHFATRAGNLRHWGHARSVNSRHRPHPGELRRSRTTSPPEDETCCARGREHHFAVGRGLAMFSRHWLIAVTFLLLTGCTVGPRYRRPAVTVPDSYRGLAP